MIQTLIALKKRGKKTNLNNFEQRRTINCCVLAKQEQIMDKIKKKYKNFCEKI